MAKLDVSAIIVDHLDTLEDYGTKRWSVRDIAWFYAVPVLASGVMVWAGIILNVASISVLITALSIFAGLLLNLLLLTHGIITARGEDERSQRRRELIRQVYKNISYSILVALGAVAVLVVLAVISHPVVLLIGSAIVFGLVGNFLLTLLMILKRVHVMLGKEYGT